MHAAILNCSLAPFHLARVAQAASMGRPQGHSISVIEVAGHQRAYNWQRQDIRVGGFQVIRLFPDLELTEVPSRQLWRRLFTTLDALRPDVVFLPGWGFLVAWFMLAWARWRRVPRVLISDSQLEDRPQVWHRKFVKKVFLRQVHSAFVGGVPHRRFLVALGFDARRTVLGCTVVDNRLFESTSRPYEPDPRLALISSLRLIPQKNILATIDHLESLHLPWCWAIAGEGPLRDEIASRIRKAGLEDKVTLLGQVPYAGMPAFYASGRVYLQPSVSETWGLAVNEAMASGLPIVVSDRCGCREDLVKPENGMLYDPADGRALLACLNRMWSVRDRWAEMGRASRAIVSEWGLQRFAEGFWASAAMATGG